MIHQQLQLPGGPIEYRRFGPESAPTLVFLHEGLGAARLWRDFPDDLAQATGCGALVYSRYGYGGSAPISPPRPLTYLHDEACQVLPGLLAALGVRRHILIGHSDGATIALIHAGAAAVPGLLAVIALAPHVFVEDMTLRGIAGTRDKYHQGLRAKLERLHGANVDGAFHGWAETWLNPAYRDWNVEAALPGIRVPTLVIQGRQDEYASLEQVDRVVAGIGKGAESLVVEDCGHTPHRDKRNEVLDAMAGFIRRVVPASPDGDGS